MDNADKMGLTQDAAEGYENYFIPAIFGQWPPLIANQAGITSGMDVLDAGCGTGIFSREARQRVGDEGSVTGLDLSKSMLGVASKLCPDARFECGDITDLPFADASFDAVVAAFMLMFVPTPSEGLREMHRVLRPGGRMVVAVWEGLDNNPVYSSLVGIVTELVGEEAGMSMAWPFVLGEQGKLLSLCQQAGIADATVSTHKGRAKFPSIAEFVRTEIDSWLLASSVDDQLMNSIIASAEQALSSYCDAQGRIDFPLNAAMANCVKTP